jgi:GMP synthase (glutamine-hydrolysing)
VSVVRVLAVQHEDDAGPGFVGERIRALGARLDVVHPYLGDPIPDTTDGYAGLVVLGGTPGPYDDTSARWLPDVRRLIAGALTEELPLLGICLGGELLAAVAGGKVDRIDGPPEIGLYRLQPTDAARTDPLFSGLPAAPRPSSGTGRRSSNSRPDRSPCAAANASRTRPSALARRHGAPSSIPRC